MSIPTNFPTGYTNELIWWPNLGMGWHPCPPLDYDLDYWKDYCEKDQTDMSKRLTKARCDLVERHYLGKDLIDIGIGGGRFVLTYQCYGYDINSQAKQWLENNLKWRDPYLECVEAISCWDSLEHIVNPENLIRQVKSWVFVSLPTFKSGEEVLISKHYKPGEHIWYWSVPGLVSWFQRLGFKIKEHNRSETELGREGIDSFAFQRSSK